MFFSLCHFAFLVYFTYSSSISFCTWHSILLWVDFKNVFLVLYIWLIEFHLQMKLRHGEKILPVPLFFIILSFACCAAALFCFQNKNFFWSVSGSHLSIFCFQWILVWTIEIIILLFYEQKRAAQSRTFNRECLVLNFYDLHDTWHFLSATSLFFFFMVKCL